MVAASTIRIVPKNADARVAPGLLQRLSDLKGFAIAGPVPDFRGWKVELPDRHAVGKVDDLMIDTTSLAPRYLEVKADHRALGTDEDEWVMVPVQRASIDDQEKRVSIEGLPATGFAKWPRFPRGVPSPAQEQQLSDYFGVDIMRDVIQDELPPNTRPVI